MASELSSNDIEGGFVKRGKAEDDVTKDKGDHQIPEQTSIESDIKTRSLFRFNSDYRQKFDVFLSHSGKQKNFVRQLHRDLTNQGLSCFFDQDRESLPVAEDFSPRIFEAAKTCKIGALLLSKDFLESKWPMLELSAFVEARDITCTNPNLKILPLFFLISPDSLKKTKENDEKWKQLEISRETPAEWHQALKAIRRINGLKFSEGGNEVEFREEIATEIWRLLPTPSPRYHVPCMQGEARMCLEVANFIKNVQPNEERIRIAGLYGIAGQGKTTLGKAFCNFNLGEFEGKVCHLEFSRGSGNPIQNIKLALQYLTRRHLSYVQTLTSEDQAKVELDRRLKGQRVLLVLDNITEESIEEVAYYLKAELGENSCILLCARSVDLLEKHFNIGPQSCMRVPRLEEEEAISILLERAFPGEVQVEDRCFALKCAKRCLFKENCRDNGPRAQTFHPLALKAFGGYLLGKHRLNMSKGLDEIDGMVDGAGDGLDEVFTVLGQAFDDMRPEYRTIFMLLTVYVLPNMSLDKVLEWTAININEEISFIEKAVEDLVKMAFIEEFKSEIRIHDLYIEFAESKANKMERWLWWNEENDQCSTRGLIPKNNGEFELAKLEKCMYRRIHPKYVGNLFALQLVDVENIGKLDLGSMDRLRSITLRGCKLLAALEGMEKLVDLAWLQIRGVHPMFELPELSSLQGLQHLEIDIAGNQVVNQLGDLTYCFRLREINVCCPSLLEFPRLDGMSRLEKVEFSLCEKVKDRLDCSNCVKLQSIVLNLCSQMAASPLLAGCKKLTKLVLSECDAVTACPDVDMPSALKTLELFISSKASSAPKYLESYCKLEHLQLWNMGELMDLPSFKRLSSLTVLKLGKCGIREPPDLAGCDRLEDVYFFTLKKLERFPNFSSLRELKKLSLCNCISVKDPPDIKGCHKLQVFHLLYNDNMKGLSRMDRCAQLEEIQVSWYSKNEVSYQGIDPDSFDEDLEFCLEHFKDEKFGKIGDISVPEALKELQWLKGKTMLVKRYFRGVKLHYSLTAPSEDGQTKRCGKKLITLKRMIDGKVMALPTMARDTQDRDWFNKVEGYFAGKKDIAHASTSSLPLNIVDSLLLPLSPRYPIPPMQGEARMCEEVANFFDSVPTNGKGIRIAGLYGMPGQGKTTLAKAFCNSNLTNFDGKVCYLEFCGGNTLQRQKLFLRYFTQFSMTYLESLTKEDDVDYLLKTVVNGQRVLLVLDNITVGNIDEVKYYLEPDLGENSCILVSARSLHVLEKDLKIDSQSCMHVPRLEEEQAIAILCEMKPSVASGFPAESRDFALKCAKKCSFKEDTGFAAFHPLALKVFGRHLFCKQSLYLSKWVEEVDGAADGSNDVFVVLDKAFDGMEYKCRSIFMLLTRHIPPSMSTEEALKWLAANCNEGIAHTKIAVEDLYEGAFIEEIEPEIRIHDLIKEFAEMNDKDKYDTLDDFVPTPSESARLTEISSSNFSQGSTSSANSLAWLKDSVPPNNPSLNGFKEITGATSQFTSGRLGKSSVNKSNLRGKAVALTVRKLKSFRDFSHHANISTDDISISSRFFSNVSTISTFSFASYKDSVLPDNPIVYELKEIIGVTSQFTSGRLGKSSFYKSNLRGKAVAITVRRLKKHRDFRFGLRQICIAHHARIVNLLGGCCERENVYLVYDFVHGASLGECLRNSRMPEFTVLKTWISRIQIATDVAQALEYLHYYTGMNYVHNHLNSSSIKITEPDYRAKICHVGVSYLAGEYDLDGTHEGYDSSKGKGVSAEITEDEENAGKSNPGIKLLKGSKSMRLTGRQGYMAPEYVCTGIVSRETDVFSFGVILLELMSGHEPVRYVAKANGQLERVSLIETMNKILLSDDHAECIGKLRSWIDPRLKDSFPMGCAEKVARLSAACVDSEPDKRPDMRNVAGQLSKLYIFSQQWSEQLQANKDLITTTFEAR